MILSSAPVLTMLEQSQQPTENARESMQCPACKGIGTGQREDVIRAYLCSVERDGKYEEFCKQFDTTKDFKTILL